MAEQNPVDSLLPTDDDSVPSPDEALADLADEIDAEAAGPDDLIVALDEPPPLGRSVMFDFAAGRMVTGAGRSPLATRGQTTLLVWIEKCLRTENGASPIHPPEYGLVGTTQGIGQPYDSPELADLEDRIREALTFHPLISDITDFAKDYDPDDEFLAVRFTVVIDDDTRLPVEARLA